MVEAARSEGRAAARRFTDRLPWLTESQADEVRRAYATEYVALREASWRRTLERARVLRGEYECRYRGLRVRVVGLAVAIVAGVVVPAVAVAGRCGL
ncbi:hypothetical protein G3I40_13830 [Streptomyces sp. SID14478]|nr:hypothetical protein [Streptomyces sp. SID14478]NEB76293.1 hypothetical protein [Streptomyces sp. SID14478]